MLRTAGSGMLSVGLQQVADRPFMLSEWIHVFPNEWGVEGPAILGAYGLGLQGWDVSYMFQNRDNGGFSDRIGRDTWDVTAPQVLGVFPAVARQVLRGDVKEADLLAPLYVHVPSLAQGKLGFADRRFSSTTSRASTRTRSRPAPWPSPAAPSSSPTSTATRRPSTSAAFQQEGFLTSSTGQLAWKEAGDTKLGGYFTINTPGTKAVVGFA